MKKRRHRAKSDILIDLTSLLDVIFIVLLVVIGRQQTLTVKQQEQIVASQTIEEASAQAEEARAKYELYMDQLDMSDQLQNYVCALSVYAYYNEMNVTERHISILRKGADEEIETFDLRGENVTEPMKQFRAAVEAYIAANEESPIILSLNEGDEKILYRDEKAILNIFKELSMEHDNVFVKLK